MDRLIIGFDRALRTLSGVATSTRPVPGGDLPGDIVGDQRRHVAALMRVNHSGEVCAQALYQGQALLARDDVVARAMRSSADEETDHLAWTAQRIAELGGRTSWLDPLWFAGAFLLGAGAAALGDRWSLGFLRETERQVVAHLTGHLAQIPDNDEKSRAIVAQMRDDEAQHAEVAKALGGGELPAAARRLMRLSARVMTGLAYRV